MTNLERRVLALEKKMAMLTAGTNDPYTLPEPREADEIIKEILFRLGVPAHLDGYRNIVEAVKIVMDTPSIPVATLYAEVASKTGKSGCIDRSMRHAIEVAWSRGNVEEQERFFGNTVDHKRGMPTVGHLVWTLAEEVKHIMEEEQRNAVHHRS